MEHNDLKYYSPPLPSEDFSTYKNDDKFALKDGLTFLPLEFGEENYDLLFNSISDCIYLNNKVESKKIEI